MGTFRSSQRQNLGLFLFLFFPFFLGFLGNRLFFPSQSDTARRQVEKNLDEAISQVEQAKFPLEYFSRTFEELENRFSKSKKPKSFIHEASKKLKLRFPDSVELLFFDKDGNAVEELCDRRVPKSLARRFIREYTDFTEKHHPISSLSQGFVRSFLGHLIPQDREIHSRFHFALPPRNEQYTYFSRPSTKGTFFLFFRPKAALERIALEDCIRVLNGKNPGVILAPAFQGKTTGELINALGLKNVLTKPLWNSLQKSPGGQIWVGSHFIKKLPIHSTSWVVGVRQMPPQSDSRSNFLLELLFFAPVFLFISVRLLRKINRFLFSVRVKMVASFLYVSAVPLVIMGIIAGRFLLERQSVLESEVHRESEKVLMSFDRSIRQELAKLQMNVHLKSWVVPQQQDPFLYFQSRFEAFKKRFRFDFCRVYDRNGEKIMAFQEPGLPPMRGEQTDSLGKFVRTLVRRLSKAEFDTIGDKPEINVLSGMTVDPYFYKEFDIRGQKLLLIAFPLGGEDLKISHIVFLTWNRERFEWDYLRKNYPRFNSRFPNGGFFVKTIGPPNREFPSEFRFKSVITPFLEKVNSPARSFRKEIQHGAGRFLLTAIRGNIMNRFALIGLVSDREIRREIRELTWKVSFFSLVVLGVCLIIGFLLARIFISPIGHLDQGMESLKNRDFESPIPVQSKDELGKVAMLFNETMADLSDLEVAKVVQDSFFPPSSLKLGSWDVFGKCTTASRVGGDYFDYKAIDRNRLMIALGDVSGHGVGAALVVGMAKAVMSHPATAGNPDLILKSLHWTIFSTLKRKKMMSCLVGFFNTNTMEFHWSNAGQAYPILIRDGVSSFQKSIGLPAGAAKNFKVETHCLQMKKGDTLVVFSDGLIEATDSQKQPIGYGRFLEEVPSLVHDSAQATENAIRAWLQKIAGPGPWEDDVTVLVLQESNDVEIPK